MKKDILQNAATQARGIAIDAVHACSSGHLGLPLGCADIGAVLWGEALSYNPDAPKWINRDRFILSAGHGSMFIYTWLHLSGYPLTMDQLKNFRQHESGTPGHPESFETEGVEATTGPLGQGIGNAVGFAMSQKIAGAKFNTGDHTIFDSHTIALFGDGCMQEGISSEASSFAGHNKLDNLILIYDSNDVTLDAMADQTQSEDVAARYEAYGFEVFKIDGHDMDAVASTLAKAKSNDNGKPKLIIARTEIGRGIPEVAGKASAHGEGGAKFAEEAHKHLGLPAETFTVSDDVRSFFAEKKKELVSAYGEWQTKFDAWKAANPKLAEELANGIAKVVPSDLIDTIPTFPEDDASATRAAGGAVIQSISEQIPHFITGSADLYGSTKNYIKNGGDWGPDNYDGKNIWYGIREHAMGAISNGIAYDGLFRPSNATFLVFADYLRPSIRLAALSGLPVVYIFTHDSVGVGEDGPTHQPVETVSGLRVIPGLDVIRPGDAEETAGAFAAAAQRTEGPTLLALSRQGFPAQNSCTAKERREGVFRGAYTLVKETAALETILLATGSEVQHVVDAAKELGAGTRVVSVPCMERFDRQSDKYREEVLPAACTKRVAIEAGVSGLWYKYASTVIGIDRFGLSAPGNLVMEELGMTAANVVKTVKGLA